MRRSIHSVTAVAVFYGLFIILLSVPLKLSSTSLLEGISVVQAGEKAEEATVSEFKVRARHKAVRLTWKANIAGDEPLTFEILRSMVRADAEYTLVKSIKGSPGSKTYRYVDKSVPVEENYFYKIKIPETKEIFGPLQVRPPFSMPST
ncbi:MAG: hypothetical protein JRJ65_00675 [Deltaproteobacteria bacterium]|nr:hypothetical protein [Deltaproteobacteria bacterium]